MKTLTLTLAEYYTAYILGSKQNTRHAAIILGEYIHSIDRNPYWSVLYRVYVRSGEEVVKRKYLSAEKVTLIFRDEP